MSFFESLKEHAIWDQIQGLKSQAYDLEVYTPQGLIALEALKENIHYVDWCLSKSNHSLISETLLNTISGQLNTIQSAMETLRTNPTSEDPNTVNQNAAQLSAISKALTSIFQALPYPRVQQIFSTEANAAIEEVEQNAMSSIAGLTEEQRKVSEAVTAQTEELNKRIIAQEKLILGQEEKLGNFQQKVSNASADLDALRKTKETEFDNVITERKTTLSEWSSKIEAEGKDFLTKIQEMYRLSGDTTLSGRFIASANSEWWGYIWTSMLALIFFAGAIAVTVLEWWTVGSFLQSIFTDPLILFFSRISIIAVFLVPATVFASNSAKHRRAEVWLRTMGVRIATLKPYLDELGGDEQYSEELKKIILSFFVSELRIEPRQNTGLLGKMSGKIDVDQIPDFLEKFKLADPK